MSKFLVAEAQLVALFMEAVTFGMYVVTFALCAHALFWDRQGLRRTINWPMVFVMVLMAIFATLDVALGLRHNLDAFIFYKGAGGPAEEFDNISYWVNVMKTVDTQVMSLIGDAMLIYRCWVVFAHSWTIALVPLLMWLADVACSVMIILITATLHTDALISQQKLLKPFLYSFFSITIALNFLTTGIIVWRIRKINKESAAHVAHSPRSSKKLPATRLESVIRIIIESGMLYTLFVILTFITELAGSNAIYGVSDMMVIIVGISFNLIIIRVDQATHASGSSYVDSAHPTSYPLHFMRSSITTAPGGRGVEVMISRDVDRVSEPVKHESITGKEERSGWLDS